MRRYVWSGVCLLVVTIAVWMLHGGWAPASAGEQSAAAATAENETTILGRAAKLVDLTHSFDEQTIYWPTEIPFHLERGPFGVTPGGWFYSANRFHMAEHSGTHLDAPIHFWKDAAPVDQVPLTQLVGSAVVIDVSRECASNPDFELTRKELDRWEADHHRIPERSIVLVNTGYAKRWSDRARYLGTAETGAQAIAKLHFPGVDPEAALWLVRERKLKAIGIDTASIDRGQSKDFATHVVLCSHGVSAFENVTNLEQLPAEGFTVIALPMKIGGGSGGPLRIVAAIGH